MNSKFGISYNTTGAFWCSVILYFFIIFFIFFKLSRYEESIKYTNDKDAFMDVFVVESDISQSIKAPEQNEQKIEEITIKKQIEPPLELKQETTNKDI
ncbi:MAG: TonB C-terminal domain-containing protein, partial [Campylobacter sp.]|nr:TonB C-terminal domain-containing protein [Campylobacter sp.]